MRVFLRKAVAWVASHTADCTALAGLALIAYGVSLVYLPAGIITAGVGLVLTAIDASR